MLFRIVVLVFVVMQIGSFAAASEPPLVRTSKTTLAIPFSVSDSDAAARPTHIELLFSPNKGRQWFSYSKLAPNANASKQGEFSFTAPSPADGEYWFAFRTHLASGEIRQPQPLAPQLRILIETTPAPPVPAVENAATRRRASKPEENTAITDPLGGTPLTPPKRLPTPHVTPNNTAPKELELPPEQPTNTTTSLPLLIPAAPTAFHPLPPEPKVLEVQTNLGLSDEAIAELIADMEPSLAVPITVKKQLADVVASSTNNTANNSAAPGRIIGVTLANAQEGASKIVVRWNVPADREVAAAYRVDVLKGKTADGPWQPLVINYLNGGEYWWYLSHEDFDPFFLALRTRNGDNADVAFDKTRQPIAIVPSMLSSPEPRR